MVNICSTLWSFISGNYKSILLIALVIVLGYIYYSLYSTVQDLKLQNTKLQSEIVNAHQQINELTLSANAVANELESANNLLQKCYNNVTQRTNELSEIEQIMDMNISGTCELNNEDIKEKTNEYTPITQEQNKAGINFINRKYNSLR